ncbi:MAG: hypothetical protein Kow0054_26570 [Deferrisoma sp.]
MPEFGPFRILVVDDEPAVGRTLCLHLRLHGYECRSCHEPTEALGLLESPEGNPFHLVITDLVMPGLDGLTLIRRCREAGSPVQFVVITAYHQLDRVAEAYRLGVFDYLVKPFESLDEVTEVVRGAEARYLRWRRLLLDAMEAGS